jgi:hypothetical protein
MLKFPLLAGSRWKPDSGILAGNFYEKLPAAGSVNELCDTPAPPDSSRVPGLRKWCRWRQEVVPVGHPSEPHPGMVIY